MISITLPKCKSIFDSTFRYDSRLTTVDAPNVTSVGQSAFYYCKSLSSAPFLSNVTYIGSYAFAYTDITELVNHRTGVTIGSYAFRYCSNFSYINLTRHGGYLQNLSNYSYLVEVSAPYATMISADCFYNDSKIESVYNVFATNVYDEAFGYCYKLKELMLPKFT